MKWLKNKKGYLLIQALVYGSLGVILVGALIGWGNTNLRVTKRVLVREKALQVAEAGVEYYRWHLAHAPQDFKDGTSGPGPYVHNYYDKEGKLIGKFTLIITEPLVGSTLVTIVSKGETVEDPSITRSIEVKLAIPSLAKYAFVANSVMRFGQTTEVFGPIHSNEGVRFDGVAHNLVTSAKEKYDDPDHNDHGNDMEFGVHTHVNMPPPPGSLSEAFHPQEAPPTTPVPTRTDVFMAGRSFPVPAVDFNGLTSNLSQLKTLAQTNGRYFAASGQLGYNLVLKTNDTFDLYRVTSLKSAPHNNCRKPNWSDQEGWGTWTIRNQSFIGNYAFPTNGVVFVEDNLWVEGQINTARLTIASGRFPENANTYTNITFNKDILYSNYDGRDTLALIAQNNINAGMESEDNLRVDAALVAKNGRIGRFFYNTNCSPWHERAEITLFGTLITNKRYGFAYADNDEGGYALRKIYYDANLLYSPPPSFPLTSDQYEVISWREL